MLHSRIQRKVIDDKIEWLNKIEALPSSRIFKANDDDLGQRCYVAYNVSFSRVCSRCKIFFIRDGPSGFTHIFRDTK